MIQLVPLEHDDLTFVSLARRILNGAVAALQMREVYLVQIDNWFGDKWLGWWSRWRNKKLETLRVPPFNPNRVCLEEHFIWDAETATWKSVGMSMPLHIRQAGRLLLARELEQFSKSAAFVWYSGNTTTNKAGSLMFYASSALMAMLGTPRLRNAKTGSLPTSVT